MKRKNVSAKFVESEIRSPCQNHHEMLSSKFGVGCILIAQCPYRETAFFR